VYFKDGSYRSVPIKENTTSAEVCLAISQNLPQIAQLGSVFILKEVSSDGTLERVLSDDERPLEAMRKWKNLNEFKFFITVDQKTAHQLYDRLSNRILSKTTTDSLMVAPTEALSSSLDPKSLASISVSSTRMAAINIDSLPSPTSSPSTSSIVREDGGSENEPDDKNIDNLLETLTSMTESASTKGKIFHRNNNNTDNYSSSTMVDLDLLLAELMSTNFDH